MPEARLLSILRCSEVWSILLERCRNVLVADWAVGGGALAQTVWNHLHGLPERHGIRDIDIVYYDADDLSAEAESQAIAHVTELFCDLGVALDVKNQARVHLWYERHFGRLIPPYRSLAEAIVTWPTTATAVALAPRPDGEIGVIAPFGLWDLLGGIVRPNRRQITEDIYQAKIARWRPLWPKLDIKPWSDGVG